MWDKYRRKRNLKRLIIAEIIIIVVLFLIMLGVIIVQNTNLDEKLAKTFGFIKKTEEKKVEQEAITPGEVDLTAKAPEYKLAAVKVGDLWGYIDLGDNMVIKPEFQKAYSFSDARAMVVVDDKYGFIDSSGKMAIDAKYQEALSFNEGLAPVKENDYWGYVDVNGNLKIPRKFDYAGVFMDSRAIAGLNGKKGVINKEGNFIINPEYDYISKGFSNGIILAGKKEGDYFIDRNGIVIAGPFELSMPFSDGRAAVKYKHGWGFINLNGDMVIRELERKPSSFSSEVAAVNKGEKWGFIDKGGSFMINPVFLAVNGEFSEGLMAVKIGEKNSWGFMDENFDMSISAKFEEAKNFSSKRAAVKINGSWGYIDKTGAEIIQAEFSSAGSFISGFAKVERAGNTNVIYKEFNSSKAKWFSGVKIYLGPDIEDVDLVGADIETDKVNLDGHDLYKIFGENLAAVKAIDKKKWGYVNKSGDYVIGPKYEDARIFTDANGN